MTLRQHLAKVIVEALVRAAVWLFRAQELPVIEVGPRTTFHEALVSRPLTSRRCNEFQLLVLLRVDGTLAYVFGTSPEPGHRIDTTFRQ